jgi:hypothetical protein
MSAVKPFDVFSDGFSPELTGSPEWQAAAGRWKDYMVGHLPSTPTFKFCPCCWQLKPISSFTARSHELDGHSAYCRECFTPEKWMKNHPGEKPEGCMSSYECIMTDKRIYLNISLSRLIREKGFKHCVLKHQDGRMFFIFCEKASRKNLKFLSTGGVTVVDESIIDDIIRSMNVIFTDPIHLQITVNKAVKSSAVIIELIMFLSHKDYLENPFAAPVTSDSIAEELLVDDCKEENEYPDDNERSCTTGYKFCIRCCTPKLLSEFNHYLSSPDGYNHSCRDCVRNKTVETKKIFDTNTALLFGNKIFFAPEVSSMIRASLARSCTFMKNSKGSSLFFNRSYPGKNNGATMFTSCDSSGITALKDEYEVSKLREILHLDEEHAYWLKLFIRKSSHNGLLVIGIQNSAPYCFREETAKDSVRKPTEAIQPSGQENIIHNSGRLADNDQKPLATEPVKNDSTNKERAAVGVSGLTRDISLPVDLVDMARVLAGSFCKTETELIIYLLKSYIKMYEFKIGRPVPKENTFPFATPRNDESEISAFFENLCSCLDMPHPICMISMATFYLWKHPESTIEGISTVEELYAEGLKKLGWKLQRPVKVIHYEDF